MSTISKNTKYCCTCKYFGGNTKLKGSIVEYDNTSHICKIKTIEYENINLAMISTHILCFHFFSRQASFTA